jgi:hypothetical protein
MKEDGEEVQLQAAEEVRWCLCCILAELQHKSICGPIIREKIINIWSRACTGASEGPSSITFLPLSSRQGARSRDGPFCECGSKAEVSWL